MEGASCWEDEERERQTDRQRKEKKDRIELNPNKQL
jgi:hypothetical protein